jgi:hypothetical protein
MVKDSDGPMFERRQIKLVLIALLALFALATVTLLVESNWRHYVDGAMYLLTARHLGAGEGYVYLGAPFFLRPPGLAFLLSPLVSTPFDPDAVLPLNLVIQFSAAATFLFVALAMRRLHGTLVGVLVALLFAFNATTVEAFNAVFSEFPHIALFFAGVWLLLPKRGTDEALEAVSDAGAPAGWLPGLIGAVCIGASLWFRTVGVLVIPAIVLAALLRRRGAGADPLVPTRMAGTKRSLVFAGLAFAVILPWLLHSSAVKAEAPRPTTQLLTFDHVTGMFHVNPRDPDSPTLTLDQWSERLASNIGDVSDGLAHALLGGSLKWARIRVDEARQRLPTGFHETSPLAFGLAALIGLCLAFTAWRRRSLLDLYALAYLAIALTWFTYVQRMLLPVLPMLLSSVVYSLSALGRGLASRWPRARELPLTIVACVLLLVSLLRMPGALEGEPARADLESAERRVARWIQNRTDPDAVVLHEHAAIMSLLSNRRVYTWRNLPGAWPADCPPVDWAFYGPHDKFPELQVGLDAASIEHLQIPVQYRDGTHAVYVYRMR